MKIIEQSWQWLYKPDNVLQFLERCGRTAYKSENRITEGSAIKFVKMLMDSKHESVIEHVSASVLFITNRAITHELIRHRLSSYTQESTRYVKYNNDNMEFIKPVWWDTSTESQKRTWVMAMDEAEQSYNVLMNEGWKAEQARDVLPNALKTEIVVTTNLREWRHIFKLRTDKSAHPQIRELMTSCLTGFRQEIPVIFDEI